VGGDLRAGVPGAHHDEGAPSLPFRTVLAGLRQLELTQQMIAQVLAAGHAKDRQPAATIERTERRLDRGRDPGCVHRHPEGAVIERGDILGDPPCRVKSMGCLVPAGGG
jgi:hypothetical protein